MPVDVHPKFECWAAAFAELREANVLYGEALVRKYHPALIEHAKLLKDMAQDRYDRIAHEIEDAGLNASSPPDGSGETLEAGLRIALPARI